MGFRARFEDQRWFVTGVIFFLLLGLLALRSTLTGPSHYEWTGPTVRGVDTGGIVSWTYHGQTNSIDKTSRFASNTVYFDPRDPTHTAKLVFPIGKAFEIASIVLPLCIALAFVGLGLRSRARYRRAGADPRKGEFGHGMDPAFLAQYLKRPPP